MISTMRRAGEGEGWCGGECGGEREGDGAGKDSVNAALYPNALGVVTITPRLGPGGLGVGLALR